MKPKYFNAFDIEELIQAQNNLFAQKPFPIKIVSETIKKILAKNEWINGSDLISDLKTITDQKTLDGVAKTLSVWKQETETKPVESTVPQKDQLEKLKEEAEQRKAVEDKAKAKAKAETEKLVGKLKERQAQEAKKVPKKIKVSPEDEIPVTELSKEDKEKLAKLIKAAKKDPKGFQNKIEEKIREARDKSDPGTKNAVDDLTIKKTAATFTARVLEVGKEIDKTKDIPDRFSSVNSSSFLTAMTNPANPNLKKLIPDDKTREDVSQKFSALMEAMEAQRRIDESLLSSVIPQNLVQTINGPAQTTKFNVAADQEDEDAATLDVEQIYRQGSYVRDLYRKIATGQVTAEALSTTTTAIVPVFEKSGGFMAKRSSQALLADVLLPTAGAIVAAKIAPSAVASLSAGQGIGLLSPAGALTTYVKTSNVLWAKPVFNFSLGKFFIEINSGLLPKGVSFVSVGVNTGRNFFGVAALKSTEKLGFLIGRVGGTQKFIAAPNFINKFITAARATQTTVTTSAGTTVYSGLLAKIASLSPKLAAIFAGVGGLLFNIIGAVVFWVAGKAIEKIADWIRKHQEDIKLALTAAAVAFFARKILRRFFRLLRRITSSIVDTIAKPVIIGIVISQVAVALILFIINSGAYIVPPEKLADSISSSFIEITKTAEPAGPFANSQLTSPGGIKVEYTISIKAKKGTLTKLRFSDACEVKRKEGAQIPNCPDPEPAIPADNPGLTISPASSYVIKYSRVFKSNDFSDSLVEDTFSVTANTSTISDVTSFESASIKIGNPPEESQGCPSGCPLPNCSVSGYRSWNGFTHYRREAVDLAAGVGTPVQATHNGVVDAAGCNMFGYGGYGCVVNIKGKCKGKTFYSIYAHLKTVSVRKGNKVTKGTKIGTADATGNSYGSHLHYEFFRNYWSLSPNGPSPKNPPFMKPPYLPINGY